MKNVLIDFPFPQELTDRLCAIPGITVTFTPDVFDEPSKKTLRELPPEVICNAHALLCSYLPKNFEAMEKLELVQLTSAGYEHIVGWPFSEHGIRVCNGRGFYDVSIAEWNIAMMINLLRDFPGLIRNQDRHVWDYNVRFEGEVFGRTVGIWGYGGIGRHTARLAKALGLTVRVLTHTGIKSRDNIYVPAGAGDPEGKLPDRAFTYAEIDEFLADLDFLILAFPKTPATIGLVGEKELRRLPKHAFLINPARGQLVREDALHRALREGWIAGAALDTHHEEPLPSDNPLWSMPNVIITPHIAGVSRTLSYCHKLMDVFTQNVRRFLAGQPLLNELGPLQLAGKG